MMNQTIIIVILIVIILCIEFGQGLRCYQHDYCLGRCPTLISSTVQCKPGLDKCWKFTSPLGTMRGCGDHRCKIQLDTGIFDTASVCCSSDLSLQCYSHDTCSANCPQLSETVKTCGGDENKCYKAALPVGVSRGCARERCNVQVNANSVMANVCCEKDLCNSARTSKMTIGGFFMMIGALFLIHI
ncbi:unnamed protein product [Rotaria sordida]|uniref:Uncharacterized protein n=1 Tax=Rotaria sordida TaxID=392033 RepID=A0A819MZY7_9BILA|nr:unnamed protein product [Rotaria sordida]CAF3876699.1 unnamed protein product [Rotaria sordida]CAF3989631.1 unnamed protein product [Rotaria sordida]